MAATAAMASSQGDAAARRLSVLLPHLSTSDQTRQTGLAVVLGGAVLDIKASPSSTCNVIRGTSVPGKVLQVPGGVGRNIAEGMSRLLLQPLPPPVLATIVGDDAAGSFLLKELRLLRIDLSLVEQRQDFATPCVVAVFDDSHELAACVADVTSLEEHLDACTVRRLLQTGGAGRQLINGGIISLASLLVIEANLGEAALQEACEIAAAASVPIFMEPVSVPKSTRCLDVLPYLSYLKPNDAELFAIADALRTRHGVEVLKRPKRHGSSTLLRDMVPFAAVLLATGLRHVVLTMGSQGAALLSCHRAAWKSPASSMLVHVTYMQAMPTHVINLSGAGDALVSGMAAALLHNKEPHVALAYGMAAARLAIQSDGNVPAGMTFSGLAEGAQAFLLGLGEFDVSVSLKQQ